MSNEFNLLKSFIEMIDEPDAEKLEQKIKQAEKDIEKPPKGKFANRKYRRRHGNTQHKHK